MSDPVLFDHIVVYDARKMYTMFTTSFSVFEGDVPILRTKIHFSLVFELNLSLFFHMQYLEVIKSCKCISRFLLQNLFFLDSGMLILK